MLPAAPREHEIRVVILIIARQDMMRARQCLERLEGRELAAQFAGSNGAIGW